DVSSYMFGSVLAVSKSDAVICAVICSAVLILYALFYNTVFAVTFDETFAASGGMKTGLVNTAMASVTALTVVVGMRLMGTLLISALIVFPAISAMKICRAWKSTVVCSAAFAAGGFLTGLISAFAFSLPTGPAVVAADAVIYGVCAAVSVIARRKA
nr:metal ABC transporter permease [Clostridiales bacterium]